MIRIDVLAKALGEFLEEAFRQGRGNSSVELHPDVDWGRTLWLTPRPVVGHVQICLYAGPVLVETLWPLVDALGRPLREAVPA